MSELDGARLSAAYTTLAAAQEVLAEIGAEPFDHESSQRRYLRLIQRYTSCMRAEALIAQQPLVGEECSTFELDIIGLTQPYAQVSVRGNMLMYHVYEQYGGKIGVPVLGFRLVLNSGQFLEYDRTVEYYNLDGTESLRAILNL